MLSRGVAAFGRVMTSAARRPAERMAFRSMSTHYEEPRPKLSTYDDLPVPKGPFAPRYKAKQQRYNMYMWGNLAITVATFVALEYMGMLDPLKPLTRFGYEDDDVKKTDE